MMTPDEIRQCQEEWERTEMSDLSSDHLRSERDKLYHKWFARLLDHAAGRTNEPWNRGMRVTGDITNG